MRKFKETFFWYIIYIVGILIFSWVSINFFLDYFNYTRFNKKTKAEILSINSINQKNKNFYLQVSYLYFIDNKIYFNQSRINKYFLNEYSSLEYIKEISRDDFSIWVDSRHPYISSFEKAFPYKGLVNSLVVFFVTIYFILLRIYLLKKET